MGRVYVVGIGYRPLDRKARETVLQAGVLLASNRLFEVFRRYEEYDAVKDRVRVINNVNETMEFIRKELKNSSGDIVLLASGDPMFFGIGRRSVQELGSDVVEILPDLSSIQIAFARVKIPWDNAFLMSLHGGPDPEKRRPLKHGIGEVPILLRRYGKLAILTDRVNNPVRIAEIICKSYHEESDRLTMYVCERLGYDDEKVTKGRPAGLIGSEFEDTNLVVIIDPATEERFTAFGLSETEFSHKKGLITKDEVRAVSIHKLRLPQKGVFWDIGAGSGSVSIEAGRLLPALEIYAVERDDEQLDMIARNRDTYGVFNLSIVRGEAPGVLDSLPVPDRVFIGGSGGALEAIIGKISERMSSGVVVVNATTIETLNTALQSLKGEGFGVDITEVSISRSKPIGDKTHMSALNPVFIVRGVKGEI